jgi:nitrite reductase/ring-hydroxylating ferredoxin subunit
MLSFSTIVGGGAAVGRMVPVCRADEVPEGRAIGVEVEGDRLAIFRDGEAFHALSARCPHAAGPMDRGRVEEGEAVCPLHRWHFRLRDGRCTTIRGESIRVVPCEVKEGWVHVAV